MIVRYLELESSGRRNEIRFIYTAMDARNNPIQHTESFSYTLADSKWHKVSLTVSGSEIQLLVDCHLIYRRMADHIPDRNFSASEMHLFVGQRDNQYQFKVSTKSYHRDWNQLEMSFAQAVWLVSKLLITALIINSSIYTYI